MKTYLAAAALVAALAQPAAAVTFPSLTTIYIGSGVYDDGLGANAGEATSILCSNVSGVSVQVRVLILNDTGAVAGSSVATITWQPELFSKAQSTSKRQTPLSSVPRR